MSKNEVEIPSDSVVIIYSSVLFAMGGPSNEKYQAFERFVRKHNITVTVPEQVAEELGESPVPMSTNAIVSVPHRMLAG